MANAQLHAHLSLDPHMTLQEAVHRAVTELEDVRSGMEKAFDTIHTHCAPEATLKPDYIIAMQSIDAMSQQIAAIERFIRNVTNRIGNDVTIKCSAASEGITLAAVAARLVATNGLEHDSGECDFF